MGAAAVQAHVSPDTNDPRRRPEPAGRRSERTIRCTRLRWTRRTGASAVPAQAAGPRIMRWRDFTQENTGRSRSNGRTSAASSIQLRQTFL